MYAENHIPASHDAAAARPFLHEIEMPVGTKSLSETPSNESLPQNDHTRTSHNECAVLREGQRLIRQQTGVARLRAEHLAPQLRNFYHSQSNSCRDELVGREENGEQSRFDSNGKGERTGTPSEHSGHQAEPVLTRATRIVLEGQLFASIFIGG